MRSITRQAIYDEVQARGWSYYSLPGKGNAYVVTDNKGRSSIGRGAVFSNSSRNGSYICMHKNHSYAFLEHIGLRVPDYLVPQDFASALDFLKRNKRIAVKPVDAEQSKGVTVDVVDEQGLQEAMNIAEEVSKTGEVVLQHQLEGKLYRILVVNHQLFAAAYRRAAFVTGDGVSSVMELINEKNKDPNRSDKDATPLKTIHLDAVRAHIGDEGLQRILARGEEQEVIAIASISAGGEAEDVTEIVHPFYKNAVERITKELQVSIAGIDIITDDISAPGVDEATFPIVEINSLPGFKLHLYPTAGGKARNPASAVLDAAFPASVN